MIACPNCSHENMAGSAFCVECGVALLAADALTTLKMEGEQSAGAAGHRPSPPANSVPGADTWVTLHLLDSGLMLPLGTRNEFTIGRVAAGQPMMPDVDLTPYQAYSNGVSRLHAAIRRGVSDIVLTDLESANGTFVNGRRLRANEECPLANGDVVAFGGLKIQVLLRAT